MLHLTDGVGLVVTTTSGTRLGLVRDLAVRAGAAQAPVTRVLFGEPEHPTVGLSWSAVTAMTDTGVTVEDGASPDPLGGGITIEIDDDELLLARDVLDTQVVDVSGRFLVRVADVALARELDPDPDRGALVATGIELSTAGKLNRVGFERLGGRKGQRFVPWADVHLTSIRGRAALLATHTPLLALGPAELARVLPKLSSAHVGEVLSRLTPEVLVATVNATPQGQLRHLLDGLPAPLVDPVLAAMPPTRANTMRRALRDIAASRARLTPGHRAP